MSGALDGTVGGTGFGYSAGVATPEYSRREVFPHSPLQLVAAEVRYPYAPRLRQPDVLDSLQIDLDGILPIRRVMQSVNVEVGPNGAVSQQNQEIFRLFNRASTTSVSVTPTATAIETTDYKEFDEFSQLVDAVLQAIQRREAIAAVERVGLRYIDEVRLPGVIVSAKDWTGWIADDLTAPTRSSVGEVGAYQGMVEVITGTDQKLVLRFAALDGVGVIGDDPLKRKSNVDPGPFFVLDIDSFWEPDSTERIMEFDDKLIKEQFDSLHEPTGETFQNALTDRLRQVFRTGETK